MPKINGSCLDNKFGKFLLNNRTCENCNFMPGDTFYSLLICQFGICLQAYAHTD